MKFAEREDGQQEEQTGHMYRMSNYSLMRPG